MCGSGRARPSACWAVDVEPVIVPDRADRRFKDAAWNDNALFDFIKQSYLLSSKYILQVASHKDGLNDKTQQKLEFYTRQFVEMMAPSNFVATNPEVLRLTFETARREPAARPQATCWRTSSAARAGSRSR